MTDTPKCWLDGHPNRRILLLRDSTTPPAMEGLIEVTDKSSKVITHSDFDPVLLRREVIDHFETPLQEMDVLRARIEYLNAMLTVLTYDLKDAREAVGQARGIMAGLKALGVNLG